MGEVKTSFGSYCTTLPYLVTIYIYMNTFKYIRHSRIRISMRISLCRDQRSNSKFCNVFLVPSTSFTCCSFFTSTSTFCSYSVSPPASVKLHQCDGCTYKRMYGRILERMTRLFLNVELSLAFKRIHGYLAHAHARCMRSSSFQQEQRNWKGDFRERRLNIFSLAECKSRSCNSGVNNGVANVLWQIEINIF